MFRFLFPSNEHPRDFLQKKLIPLKIDQTNPLHYFIDSAEVIKQTKQTSLPYSYLLKGRFSEEEFQLIVMREYKSINRSQKFYFDYSSSKSSQRKYKTHYRKSCTLTETEAQEIMSNLYSLAHEINQHSFQSLINTIKPISMAQQTKGHAIEEESRALEWVRSSLGVYERTSDKVKAENHNDQLDHLHQVALYLDTTQHKTSLTIQLSSLKFFLTSYLENQDSSTPSPLYIEVYNERNQEKTSPPALKAVISSSSPAIIELLTKAITKALN